MLIQSKRSRTHRTWDSYLRHHRTNRDSRKSKQHQSSPALPSSWFSGGQLAAAVAACFETSTPTV
jgi:hypothetical protein